MLKVGLKTDDYFTINGDIVIQLARVTGGQVYLAVDAAKDIPIVRGKVLERNGEARPACLHVSPHKHPKTRRDQFFPWNDDRERSVHIMQMSLDRLERQGEAEEVRILRRELERIIPQVWESEVPNH